MNTSFITIVSGLPRSGTSMMMQIIEAGGIPALTDNIRRKDEDNPRGYYEFEPVKKTKHDPSWVPAARGKAVKMVYSLIYDLPLDFEYRIVFIARDLSEVITSQKKMLQRLGRTGAQVDDVRMAELFKIQLVKFNHWVLTKNCFSMLTVHYIDMIASPRSQAVKINEFLGGGLNVEAMVGAVEPHLYRNKKGNNGLYDS